MLKSILIALFIANLTFSERIPYPGDFEELISPWEDPFFIQMLQLLGINRTESEPVRNGRIINGNLAALGQYPFMAFLLLKDSNNKTHACGGSFIKRNWILTAAHCLRDKTSAFVFAGIVDLQNGTAEWIGRINSSQMFIHDGFTMEKYMDNDIALIKLERPVPCAKNIGIVDLPCYCDGHYDLDGKEVTTMGFGTENGNISNITFNLKYTSMEVMPLCQCKKHYPFPIFDNMMCTDTSLGGSSCMGDSGSALITQILGRTVIVGIVSFGNAKCITGKEYPAVFTNVSKYIDWIQNIMKTN